MTMTWNPVLIPRRCNPHLRGFARSGGRTITGREQRVLSDAGFWEIPMTDIPIFTTEQASAYRAMIARLRQGEDILLPIFDNHLPVGSKESRAGLAFKEPASLRASRIIVRSTGVVISVGHHMTVGDRLHLVTRIASGPATPPTLGPWEQDRPWSGQTPWLDGSAPTADYSLDILPPLRGDQAVGTPVSFAALAIRCVLKNLDDGDLDLDVGRFGFASLTFVESV